MSESLSVLPQLAEDQQKMRRYFEKPEDQLSVIMEADPVCLYLETTNRCNLLCTTCPRTFEELEPEADMSWELFTSIIDQYPKDCARRAARGRRADAGRRSCRA